ncbi:MAG: hypothetical protein QM831_41000 [Kofleriaceae bacterium]
MRIVLLVVGGIALFFLWLVFGTSSLCPNCGVDLRVTTRGPVPGPMRNSCACGWRRS